MDERGQICLGALLHGIDRIFQRIERPLPDVVASAMMSSEFVEAAYQLVSENHETPQVGETLERLIPVANQVYLKKNAEDTGSRSDAPNYRYPLKPLSVENSDVMPVCDEEFPGELRADYEHILIQFEKEMTLLGSRKTSQAYFFTVYFLLKKYFFRVPSESPDISFFDHARIKAALADCLYQYHQTDENQGKAADDFSEQTFLLIEGGVSGIQKFIYNMVSPQQERARLAKRLRGRSFYLLLLAETIADYLLKELDLTITHQLWCSGGHFAILAPNTPATRKQLSECYTQLNQFLLKEFLGELSCVLSWQETSGQDLQENIGKVLRKLHQKSEREKLRKLHNVLKDKKDEDAFRFPSKACKIGFNSDDPSLVDEYVAELNRKQEGIGTILSRLNKKGSELGWLLKTYKDVPEELKKHTLRTFNIGTHYQVAWLLVARKNAEQALDNMDIVETAYLINSTDMSHDLASTKTGFKFIATHVDTYSFSEAEQINENLSKQGNWDLKERVTPGDIKSFTHMAEAGSGGFLGILRMDVDNLGAVFNIGITREKRRLSRIAALSSDMDLFFTGYFQQLCRMEFKKNTYIAYSGGDDLFVVGAWDQVFALACRVREDFKTFTCENDSLNISGGIALCKGKYPINRAAEQARVLLDDKAKNNIKGEKALDGEEPSPRRDALAIFNHRLPWRDIFALRKIGNAFVEAINSREISRTSLYKIFDLHKSWNVHRQLNIARLYYIAVRTIQNKLCREFMLRKLAKHKYLANPGYIPMLVGYTALKTKNNRKEEHDGKALQ